MFHLYPGIESIIYLFHICLNFERKILQKCCKSVHSNIEHSAMFVMTRSSIWLCHINDNFISFCLLRYLHVHRGKKKKYVFFSFICKINFFLYIFISQIKSYLRCRVVTYISFVLWTSISISFIWITIVPVRLHAARE